jgi:hypothetical protein
LNKIIFLSPANGFYQRDFIREKDDDYKSVLQISKPKERFLHTLFLSFYFGRFAGFRRNKDSAAFFRSRCFAAGETDSGLGLGAGE